MDKHKIIIVDDDEIFLDTMASILELSDFIVYKAKTAEEGFDSLVNLKPDLMLLDINLPDKNGIEVLTTIKKSDNFARMPVFLITGDTAVDVDKAFEKGADDCLFKPIDSDDLISRIKRVLD